MFRRRWAVTVAVLPAAVIAWTLNSHAQTVSSLSSPVQYDATTWYAYAQLSSSTTWSTAEALVNALPAYNGAPAELATFATDAQYNWFVSHEGSFSSPNVGEWDIAWIGAANGGGGSYAWVDGSGTISPSSAHWAAGEPQSGNLGVTWNLGLYGDEWQTRAAGDTSIGNVIVEYSPVPEPGVLALLGLGAGLLLFRRKA
jgi:hypothetical protein